jgi:hypothetical protein
LKAIDATNYLEKEDKEERMINNFYNGYKDDGALEHVLNDKDNALMKVKAV